MDRSEIEAGLQAVRAAHGPWGSHNVALPFGLFTISPEPRGDNHRTVKFLRLAADHLRRPFHDLSVLDLGCGEGLYALEFAQHGAQVVGIEGREASVAKADFARRALGLNNVRFVQADVNAIEVAQYGRFDVVICSGILYHLDKPDVFRFIETMHAMCSGVCLVDTSISLTSDVETQYGPHTYRGSVYREHAQGATPEQKKADVGASLVNEESFWIAKYDLVNALMNTGFTSVVECLAPVPYNLRKGRVTLLAAAGRPVSAFNEVGHALANRRWPPHWGTREFDEPPVAWRAG